jgi:endo-1,4-beta-xylanase
MLDRRKMLQVGGAAAILSLFGRSASASRVDTTELSPSLRTLAKKRGLLIGIQADPPILGIDALAKFIVENFDLLTPGNSLKWGRLRPAPDKYSFGDADLMFRFAEKNEMRVHGHNLCWNSFNPAWLPSTLTSENAQRYLVDHIHTVAGRYKGRVDSWDVVNEPIRIGNGRPDGLTVGPWLDTLGPQYIDIAFQSTAEADPAALRVLNLDNLEQDGAAADKARDLSLQLIQGLLNRHVPIQAVGLESHLQAALPAVSNGRKQFIEKVKSLGLQVLITELDVNDTKIIAPDDERKKQVAAVYYAYLTDVLSVSKTQRLIFWSLTDKDNWYDFTARKNAHYQRADGSIHYPGLLDSQYEPNPALSAVKSAIAS